MEYTVTHTTKYAYTSPVSVCQNIVTLAPRDNERIQCWMHRLRIRPNPTNTYRRTDFFGNILTVFSIDENHEELTISAVSRVTVRPQSIDGSSQPGINQSDRDARHGTHWRSLKQQLSQQDLPDWYNINLFLYDSPRIQRNQDYADYAGLSFESNEDVVAASSDLTNRIHKDFTYDAKATETHTPTEDAFIIRKGVCQDFAHVMIACLRSYGIPARYVSGYLRTIPPVGKPRLVGADQSHAWVAVYCGPSAGWVELDPTNNCFCGLDHIPFAWGRDYSDVVPVRGAYLGGGESTIGVSVDVVPSD